uniref:Uncharacterized protein n=1 Tax=Rhizophora mucronata TaxID=61149 RepID=A0A2P2L3G2_RHIMU
MITSIVLSKIAYYIL